MSRPLKLNILRCLCSVCCHVIKNCHRKVSSRISQPFYSKLICIYFFFREIDLASTKLASFWFIIFLSYHHFMEKFEIHFFVNSSWYTAFTWNRFTWFFLYNSQRSSPTVLHEINQVLNSTFKMGLNKKDFSSVIFVNLIFQGRHGNYEYSLPHT